ncbi:putative aldouronate transport system substrate-binding protein [Cohnella sp. OV330]|uniref:ABC transporter substrate-binding protein n=1 Tax=Cohnella sp. OV330 TaxID=1855288 RepID=UPI0008E93953|nr:ABC transporter substrate-binding protein [Cohnella sp. OV330]SFA77519.1 putative aldouronate transport system substrate-binding protein [Cohnella sp. OV330]
MASYAKTGKLLLAASIGVGLLAGCASNEKKESAGATVNKEGFPIVSEPLTLTLMAPDTGDQDWTKMKVLDIMAEQSNIKLDFRNAPKDSFDTKKNLVFASGDYPDMFYAAGLTTAEQINYGEQGILIPLETLIDEYAPNFKKVLEDNPEVRKSITAPDGHIYALPVIEMSQHWYRNPIWYNGDFLKALNIKKLPTTTDELYTYLKRVKTEDPNGNGKADEIPLTASNARDVNLRDIRNWLLGSFGVYEDTIYVDDNKTVHYTPLEEGFKQYLTFMNKLWNEELLDHESFSQTDEQKKAKVQNNQVGMFANWNAYMSLGGEPSTDDPMYAPVKSDMVDKPAIAANAGITPGAFAISSTNPSPEASMRWVDYLYSYEGALLFNKGPEGILWKYTDEATRTKEYLPIPDGGTDREKYRSTLTPNYGIPAPTINTDDIEKGLKGDFEIWVAKETQTKLLDQGARPPFPTLFLTSEEQTQVNSLTSDLNTYVNQMEAKFITGAEPLSNWDKYVDTLKKMGAEKMAKIYQGAYDRWASN